VQQTSDIAWPLCLLLLVALLVALSLALNLNAKLHRQGKSSAGHEQDGAGREVLLRTLLDAGPLAIVFYSDTGRIVFANRAASRMFFEEQPAEGKNFLRLVSSGPPAFRPALLGASDEVASFDIDGQRETYQFVRRTFAYDGEPHTLLVVQHVTREVARGELDVLKRVVRLLSHEVNNSLAPVSSVVHSARQILKSGERMDRLERVFNTIDERAQHLSEFIAGYAALARLPKPVPRDVAWDEVLSRLRVLYPHVRMTAPEAARGYLDQAQVEQALINLLKNASEAGGPPDEVALEVSPLADGGADVRVLDGGTGFSSDALENAVLPFYTTKSGGSGVGLPLVREVAEAHRGHLMLGARPSGGAIVTLRLPGRKVSESPTARLTLTRA